MRLKLLFQTDSRFRDADDVLLSRATHSQMELLCREIPLITADYRVRLPHLGDYALNTNPYTFWHFQRWLRGFV